jgi:cysteine-rich repeat protein
MSFAQVYGVVTCAVVALAGCVGDREDPLLATGDPTAGQIAATRPRDRVAPPRPIARAHAVDTSVGAAVDVDLLDGARPASDDAAALVVSGFSQGAHGTVSLAAGVATYQPTPGYEGDDRFTYTISDARGNAATQTVAVKSCRRKPECKISIAGPKTAVLGQEIHIQATASCSVGTPEVQWWHRVDDHAFSLFRPFATAKTADFLTADGKPGRHQFFAEVRARGAREEFSSNELTTQVTRPATMPGPTPPGGGSNGPVSGNLPPIAEPDTLTIAEDHTGTINVLANDSDPDGDPLTATIATAPSAGSASITSAGVVTYTPGHNYHGADSLTYTAHDNHGHTANAVLHITITSVNDPPSAEHDWLTVAENGSGSIDVTANDLDVDGDALTVTEITVPDHGTATFTGNVVTYTPTTGFHGDDELQYTIIDGHGGTSTASVFITVTQATDPPVATADTLTTAEDTAGTVDVLANDSDPSAGALTVTAFTQPTHGTVAFTAGIATYMPDANFHGTDSFTYTITDAVSLSATATVSVTVTAVNDPPVAGDDTASTDENSAVTLDVTGNDADADADPLTITAITQPAHGTATIVDAHHVTYAPALLFFGTDSFTYTISDGAGGTATATVSLTVAHVNQAPIASDDEASLDEDTAVTVDVVANDFDADGDALAITAITAPDHGLAVIADDHHITYIPAPNFHGTDALTYTISDGQGGTATASLALVVTSVNDPPVAVDDAASTDEDTAVTLDLVANDADVDGDALTVTAVGAPAHGAALIVDAHHVAYTPAANFNGADAFTYTISDGDGGTATATVTLAIAPVNDPPVAVDDAASTDEDTVATIDAVANDSDVDGDPLTITAITQPAHGTAAIADAHHVTYTPAANFNGSDAFTYTISDPSGATATAAITLAIAPVNDPPVANNAAASTFNDTPVVVALTASDVDGDALTLAIATGPAHGTLGALAGGAVTYTPAAGFTGADSFTFTASDGHATSVPATAAITVIHSVCGNGVREGREECDDGNSVAGDGCEASCTFTCGAGTGAERVSVDPSTGHCFAAYDGVTHSYQDAAAMCAAFGGHLPTLTTAGEDTTAFAAVHAGDSPWLGGDDIAVEGTFHWTTGEPFAYSHFATGKPDNGGSGGNADCLRYQADGTWTDAACASTTGTLCEVELATGTPVIATGGTGSHGVVLADLNGDGVLDLAATNPASNSVGVWFGNGAGSFALAAQYTTGTGPSAIASGDFDGDGQPDLAVVNAGANTLVILHAGSAGAFTVGAPTTLTGTVATIAAADLDGDGHLDLAIAASNGLQLWHGSGTGSFSLASTLSVFQVAALAIGDFDHDGHVDLAVATSIAVVTLHGTGGGGFAAQVTLASLSGSHALIATDLDGDGYLDLAAASGTASVSVWFGGATGFAAPVGLTTASAATTLAAGDFDGDGATDLAAVASGYATLFHRAGRAFTQAGPAVATGGNGATIAVAGNLNSDGAQDLVVANAASSNVGVLLGGAGGFAGGVALAVGSGAAATLAADFNADGLADLAIADPVASKVFIYLAGTGGLAPSATITMSAGAGPSFLNAADFNGDGKLDLAITAVGFSFVAVATGDGHGGFGTPLNVGTAHAPHQIAIADFNGDGRPDIAAPSSTGDVVSILINTGTAFGRVGDVTATGGPIAVVAGDFNGDHKQDLAIALAGDAHVKLLLGNNDGTFGAAASFAVGAASSAIAVCDLDGDGHLDVVATQPSTNQASILLGTGAGGFAAATAVATGSQPATIAVSDVDGDGHLDLVVGNAGSNDVTILHSDGAGGFGASAIPAGGPVSGLCVSDVDHDGHKDITVATGGGFVTSLVSPR